MFSQIAIVLLTAATSLVSAQYDTASSKTVAAAAAATSGAVTVVRVSNTQGALTFDPAEITAPVGAWIEFRFWPRNHSVVQSSFDKPCEPLSGGIFTGYHAVAAGVTDFPTYTIQINDTKPIWYYCSQGSHCQGGMVGVINAPSDKKLSTYADTAKKATSNRGPSTGPFGGIAGTASRSQATTPSGSAAAPSGTNAAASTRVGGWLIAAGVMAVGAFAI